MARNHRTETKTYHHSTQVMQSVLISVITLIITLSLEIIARIDECFATKPRNSDRKYIIFSYNIISHIIDIAYNRSSRRLCISVHTRCFPFGDTSLHKYRSVFVTYWMPRKIERCRER